MNSLESLNLGQDFKTLSALGGGTSKIDHSLSGVSKHEGRSITAISSIPSKGMGAHLESTLNSEKVKSVAEKVCRSISEVNKMQFRGLSQQHADKHQVRRAIRLQGKELRHFEHLLHSKNKGELQELAGQIKEVYADESLSDDEALEVAIKLQGIKLKLPPTAAQRFLNKVLTPPRALYAGITEVISGLLAGMLGALWKANLDPANPIKDPKRPPVLRVHGLMDTQGSSLPLWMMMKARRKLRNLMGKEDLKYGSGYSLSYAGLFYNNPKQTVDDYVDTVADKVISIRKQTGHKRLIMQGHSLGGLIINRFAQLQDVVKELKAIPDPVKREEKAKELRKELMIEPKIHADIMGLAKKNKASKKKKARMVKKMCANLKAKGLEVVDAQNKMEALLKEGNSEKRKQMATSLADEAADSWWAVLRDKIDPDHEEEDKRSMEAKWLISICTPYNGSRFAVGVSNLLTMMKMPNSRVIQGLKKHSTISKIIGEDARKKVSLGKRNVYNVACKKTDEFVSEGSATVNYDYRYTKVFDNLAHVGVLFSPRVANAIGGWLDDIYREAADLSDEETEVVDSELHIQLQKELSRTLEARRKDRG